MTVMVPEVLPATAPIPGLIAMSDARYIGRQDLRDLTTPEGTRTHKPIPHHEVVEALIETLGFRHLEVLQDSYAVTKDGNRMFGIVMLNAAELGVRFCLGVRNSHDKAFALSVVAGYRVMVCSNLCFGGDFRVVSRKHSANVNLLDTLSIAVDQVHRGFEPLKRRISAWQGFDLADDRARLIIYSAFIERAGIELPRHLGPKVHAAYFEPPHEEFRPRTMYSLENAFSGAIAELDPVPHFEAATKIVPFLSQFQH